MKRNDGANPASLALLAVLAFSLTTHSALATQPAPPPKPDIDLGDWDKPSKPIWMPTELQEPPPKVEPINAGQCGSRFARQVYSENICEGYVEIAYDVSSDGHAENIRIIKSRPDGAFSKTGIEYVQCFHFPMESADEPPDFRKDLKSIVTFAGSPDCKQ